MASQDEGKTRLRIREDLNNSSGNSEPNLDVTNHVSEVVREEAKEIYASAKELGKTYFGGHSSKQVALNAKVMAETREKLANIEQENERLRQARDQEENQHRERMFELETQRLAEVRDTIKALKDLGVKIDASMVNALLAAGDFSKANSPGSIEDHN